MGSKEEESLRHDTVKKDFIKDNINSQFDSSWPLRNEDFTIESFFMTSRKRSGLIRIKGIPNTFSAHLYGGLEIKVNKETFNRIMGPKSSHFFPSYGIKRMEPLGIFKRYVIRIHCISDRTMNNIPTKHDRIFY